MENQKLNSLSPVEITRKTVKVIETKKKMRRKSKSNERFFIVVGMVVYGWLLFFLTLALTSQLCLDGPCSYYMPHRLYKEANENIHREN